MDQMYCPRNDKYFHLCAPGQRTLLVHTAYSQQSSRAKHVAWYEGIVATPNVDPYLQSTGQESQEVSTHVLPSQGVQTEESQERDRDMRRLRHKTERDCVDVWHLLENPQPKTVSFEKKKRLEMCFRFCFECFFNLNPSA